MQKLRYVLMMFLAIGFCCIFMACTPKKNVGQNDINMDSVIYSEITFVKLPRMKIASHTVINSDPEGEAINIMDNWARKNELLSLMDYVPRKFGWDYPHLSAEQKVKNYRGYGYCYVLPEDFTPKNDDVDIHYLEAGEYAVLRIMFPFSNPSEKIPNGWKKLSDYILNSQYNPNLDLYFMEEVILINGITYMDLYFPIL